MCSCSPKSGVVGGCMVVDGVVRRNNPIWKCRANNAVIFEGALDLAAALQATMSAKCVPGPRWRGGAATITISTERDHIEVFERVQVERTCSGARWSDQAMMKPSRTRRWVKQIRRELADLDPRRTARSTTDSWCRCISVEAGRDSGVRPDLRHLDGRAGRTAEQVAELNRAAPLLRRELGRRMQSASQSQSWSFCYDEVVERAAHCRRRSMPRGCRRRPPPRRAGGGRRRGIGVTGVARAVR